MHARAIGRARMKSVGRYHINEPILAWAEIKRSPHDLPALGGLSGGPMLDGRGHVAGVLVASSKRRGRVMTTTQSSIQELLTQVPQAQMVQPAELTAFTIWLPATGWAPSIHIPEPASSLTNPQRRSERSSG